jgi:hypothetical protein
MATCPRCLGALTEDHKCPYGMRQRVADAVLPIAIGALVGGGGAVLINDAAPTALVLAASALGAVLGFAIRQAVAPRS